MVRYLAILLFFIGVLFFLAGQWMVFEIYTNTKLSKMNQNIASLLASIPAGKDFVSIPNSEENFFLIKTGENRVISTSKTPPTGDYLFTNLNTDGSQVQVYTKKIGIVEYFNLMLERPFVFGVSLSGLILLLLSPVLFITGKQEAPVKQDTEFQKDILNRLRALRTALALSGVIPHESIQEAKGIIDNIIKKMEVKK